VRKFLKAAPFVIIGILMIVTPRMQMAKYGLAILGMALVYIALSRWIASDDSITRITIHKEDDPKA